MNVYDKNIAAYNVVKKTIYSCENLLHLETTRNMIEAYGRLYRENPNTALRYNNLMGHYEALKTKTK